MAKPREDSRASDAEQLADLGPDVDFPTGSPSMPPFSDPQALRELATGLRHGARDLGGPVVQDDGRLDLGEVRRGGGDAAIGAEDAPGGASDLRAAGPTRTDRAAGRPSTRSAARGSAWVFGTAFGIGLGLSAGWLLFGAHRGAEPAAADGSVAAPAADERAASKPSAPATDERAASKPSAPAKPSATAASPRVAGSAGGRPPRVHRSSVPAGPSPTSEATGGSPATAAKIPAASAPVAPKPKRDFRSIDRPKTGPRSIRPPASRAARPASPKATVPTAAPRPAASAVADRAPPAPRAVDKPSRAVDRLLDEALAKPARGSALARSAAAQELPSAPSKADLVGAVKVLLPAVRACAMGQKGVATVSLVVANSGRVQLARVLDAPFAGTAAGRCIEGVARKVRLPKFQKPMFRVRIPLSLQ